MVKSLVSCFRREPNYAGASTISSQSKLNLLCSFNGRLYRSPPPSNKLSYVAGETRIVSVDRNVSLQRLSSIVSDLCPNLTFFTLKCQIVLSGNKRGLDADKGTPLLSMVSDESLRCIIEEYDMLVYCGMNVRLWLFVCTGKDCDYGMDRVVDNQGLVIKRKSEFAQVEEGKEKKNLIRGDVDFLMKTAVKQQLLPGQSDPPLIDLSPEPQLPVISRETPNSVLAYGLASIQFPWSDSRDGNVCRAVNPSMIPYSDGCSSLIPNGFDCKSHIESHMHREQVVPLPTSSDASNAQSSDDSDTLGTGIRSRRLCANSARNQRIYPCNSTNQKSNLTDLGSHRNFRFYAGLKPTSNISKQGQAMRSWKQSFAEKQSENKHVCDQAVLERALECCNEKVHAEEGLNAIESKIATSIEIMNNLSLSSSKDEVPPPPSSNVSSNISDDLLKPESKLMPQLDEGKVITGLRHEVSNEVVVSSSSPMEETEMQQHQTLEEFQQNAPSALSNGCEVDPKDVTKGISAKLPCIADLDTYGLQTIENSELEYLKKVGSGAYGTVYHGKWRGSDVAIKTITRSSPANVLSKDDHLVADFWREAQMLGQLRHPNIIVLYGVVTDGPANTLATVTEYMENGSLNQVLQRKDGTIDHRKRIMIARDAAFGMEYLHEKNIVHFDLKSHNFLVNMRNFQRPVCKIGDMGLSKVKRRTLVSGGVRGTIPWMAPEILNSKDNKVTEKVDVYSFGIVMWELLTGEEPYANLPSKEVLGGIFKDTLRPEIPKWCEPKWKTLMERCWSSDPESRPSFSEIVKELCCMAKGMSIN